MTWRFSKGDRPRDEVEALMDYFEARKIKAKDALKIMTTLCGVMRASLPQAPAPTKPGLRLAIDNEELI